MVLNAPASAPCASADTPLDSPPPPPPRPRARLSLYTTSPCIPLSASSSFRRLAVGAQLGFYFLQAPAVEDAIVRLALQVAYAGVAATVVFSFMKAASTDPVDDTYNQVRYRLAAIPRACVYALMRRTRTPRVPIVFCLQSCPPAARGVSSATTHEKRTRHA